MRNVVRSSISIMGTVVLLSIVLTGCVGDGHPLAGIKPGSGAPAVNEEGVVPFCDNYATIMDGIYKYENNTWGVTDDITYQQCLISRDVEGQTQYGWTWNMAGRAPNWVYSYPEIIVGWKPWGSSVPTDDNYPVMVSDVESLTIDYDIDIVTRGGFNVAPEIWLISQEPASIPMSEPQTLITTEIMFWMDHSEGARPAGRNDGTFEFDGKKYDLWVKADHNNSGDTVSWQIYSLVSHDKQHSGTIDVIGLIYKLIEEGYSINTSEYIATVEFGTETIGPEDSSFSMGTVWINDYSVVLEVK